MTTLQINHIGESPEGKPLFEVQNGNLMRYSAGQLTPPTEKAAGEYGTLPQGLQWYLEEFFELPNEIFRIRADAVQAALKDWGRECFDALFKENARDWYQSARRDGLRNLTIKIVSNDPAVLSWPSIRHCWAR